MAGAVPGFVAARPVRWNMALDAAKANAQAMYPERS
jgi:hypothetical protein